LLPEKIKGSYFITKRILKEDYIRCFKISPMQFKGGKTLKIFSDLIDDQELLMRRATYVSPTWIYLRALALNTFSKLASFSALRNQSMFILGKESYYSFKKKVRSPRSFR